MRDWLLKKFEDDNGEFDKDELTRFVKKFIPRKDDWNAIKNMIIIEGERVKFLAKYQLILILEQERYLCVTRFWIGI